MVSALARAALQETLFFYTHLRLPHNLSKKQKKQHLNYVIEAMGLFDYRHMTMANVTSALTQVDALRQAACLRSFPIVAPSLRPGVLRVRAALKHRCEASVRRFIAWAPNLRMQHGEANAIRKRLNISVELVCSPHPISI
jgi:hypothetical protein